MPGQKDELEIMVSELKKFCKRNSINIFYSIDTDIIMSFEWDKNQGSWKKFMSTAISNNVKSIVVSIKKLSDEGISFSSRYSKFYNKISEVDIIYVLNDVGYKYHEEAKWFTEINNDMLMDDFDMDDEKKIVQIVKEVNDESVQSLVEQIINYAKNDYENTDINDILRSFWLSKGINFDFPLDDEIKSKIDEVNSIARSYLENEEYSSERARALEQVPEFLKWIIMHKVEKISMDDVRAFLEEKSIKIKYRPNMEVIFREAEKLINIKNGKYGD
ncbi:hypothetical protein [Picrophilus oshimae]|uniref:hypothetical protein n=1 Tax=Picrophilus oshimae TaxID=46632 RepID=UPI001293DC0D|nr:hypothetical protein [Picrophilus oshimae]